MRKYSAKDSSVLCILIGIMLLIVGFNGLMANIFSAVTEYIGDYKVASFSNCQNLLEDNDKVCIISQIFADDAFFMPDNNQKVVDGLLQIYVVWPDKSKNILVDWHKQARFPKCANQDSSMLQISPKCIEPSDDTVGIADNLIVDIIGNEGTIKYYNYKFNITGCTIRGVPKVRIQRKTVPYGEKVLLTVAKAGKNITGAHSFCVQSVIPYSTAIANDSNSKAITIFSLVLIIGLLFLFLPSIGKI